MPILKEEIHSERLDWFIRLRWAAVAGGAVILLGGPLVIPLDIQYGRLVPCVAALGILNGAFLYYWRRIKASGLSGGPLSAKARRLFHWQMASDLFLLTLMLFFSGGAENPLILFYLFHLAISAILFPAGESLFYAGLALGLPWLLYFTKGLGPAPESLWEGMAGLSRVHERSILWAYSAAVAGLWFFLSRLSLDLRAKERSLRERGEQLHAANEELRELDVFKNRFLKQVAARVKGPVMDAGVELGKVEKKLVPPNERVLPLVEAAKKSLWSILRLMEDLAWLSQAKARDLPFKWEWVAVYETLRKQIHAREAQALAKGIRFQLHGDPQVRLKADLECLEKVADNLIANAVQYTPVGGGDILVEFKAEGDWVELAVEDHGIGIPPQQQKKLFLEFYRSANARAHEKFGTGLGLSIVKRVLELHGGRIRVRSGSQEGTRVETWWPLVREGPGADGRKIEFTKERSP